jgi:hypothetical protein
MFRCGRLQAGPVIDIINEHKALYLLAQAGRMDAFAEAMELRNCIKSFGARNEWALVGIGVIVVSLFLFAAGISVAASALGHLLGSLA